MIMNSIEIICHSYLCFQRVIIAYFILYCEDKHQVLENASGKST